MCHVHCHVHYPPADEMVKGVFRPDQEPAARFSSALSRATNAKQAQNAQALLDGGERHDRGGGQAPALRKRSVAPELVS